MGQDNNRLDKQKLIDILQNKDLKQKLRKLVRDTVFDNVHGVRIYFNEDNNVEAHFTPIFFNQNTFRKGRYLDSLNYSKILRFPEVLKTLAGESISKKGHIDWVVNSLPKLTKGNLNMKITFHLPYTPLNKKLDEILVQELLYHLRNTWRDICEQLRYYEYSF